jgi:hypothetical protein
VCVCVCVCMCVCVRECVSVRACQLVMAAGYYLCALTTWFWCAQRWITKLAQRIPVERPRCVHADLLVVAVGSGDGGDGGWVVWCGWL